MPRERRSGSSSTPKKEKASKEQPGLRDLVQRRLIKDVFHRTAGTLASHACLVLSGVVHNTVA